MKTCPSCGFHEPDTERDWTETEPDASPVMTGRSLIVIACILGVLCLVAGMQIFG